MNTVARYLRIVLLLICLVAVMGSFSAATAADAKLEQRIDRARLIFEQFQHRSKQAEPSEYR